jgi:HPt (histidine-containing phosphotransfer) domain-containing protein
MDGCEPLEMAALVKRCCGNEMMARSILDKFIRKITSELDALASCVEQGDREKAAFIGHSIKGTAANVTAEQVQKAAADIEVLARSGDLSGLPAAVENLRRQFETCRAHVAGLLQAAGK